MKVNNHYVKNFSVLRFFKENICSIFFTFLIYYLRLHPRLVCDVKSCQRKKLWEILKYFKSNISEEVEPQVIKFLFY